MKKTLSQKLLSGLLILCMVVALAVSAAVMLPLRTGAATTDEAEWGTTTSYGTRGTLANAFTAANAQTSGVTYIRLLTNANLTAPLVLNAGKSITLDLRSYSISRTLATPDVDGYIIASSGTFVLNDSYSYGTGKITGANGAACIKIDGGSFTMNSGKIMGNRSGGVYVASGASFAMNGGSIITNTSSTYGAGVYGGGNISLSGKVTISGNMLGGTLTNGVITGGVKNNLYLVSGKVLSVSALTSGSSIGITCANTPTLNSPVVLTGQTTVAQTSYFTSDNSTYGVMDVALSGAHVLNLVTRSISFGDYTGNQLISYRYATGTIAVNTTGIASGSTATIRWYDKNGTALTTAPSGITVSPRAGIYNNTLTLNVSASSLIRGGQYYFTVTIDGFESSKKELTVAVASITRASTTTFFNSLDDAVTAAINNDVIKVLDSTTLGGAVISGKSITFSTTAASVITLTNTIRIENGTLKLLGTTGSALTISGGCKESTALTDFTLISVAAGGILDARYTKLIDNHYALIGGSTPLGGAISVADSASATLSNSSIENCTAVNGEGGAVYMGVNAKLTLSYASVIKSCSALRGGAVYMNAGGKLEIKESSKIESCTANGSGSAGGAVYSYGEILLDRASINTCTSGGDGGALYLASGTFKAQNSAVIKGCTATSGAGGAVYAGNSASVTLTGVTISESAAVSGAGIQLCSGALLDVSGNVVCDDVFLTDAAAYVRVNAALSTSSFITVYPQDQSVGRSVAQGVNTYYMTATDAKRISLASSVTSRGVKFTGTGADSRVVVTDQSVSVGLLSGGELRRMTSASGLSYTIVTTGMTNGMSATVTWYRDQYKSMSGPTYAPSGVIFTPEKVNNNYLKINITSGTYAKAGDYYFTVTVDGIESTVTTLSIARTQVSMPSVSGTYEYSGSEKTVTFINFNSSIMKIISGGKNTKVGYYMVVVGLVDTTQYEWITGSTDNITREWIIEKAKLKKPTLSGECIYKGIEQSPVLKDFNSTAMNIEGNTKKDVGKYTLIISLKDTANYMWDNYSTANVSIDWEIKKAPLTIRANDVTITYGEAPKNTGVSYTTLLGNDVASSLKGTLKIMYSYVQYGNAGSYLIIPSGLTSDNYNIVFQNGILTVAKQPVELVWSDLSFNYDGQSHVPTVRYKSYTGSEALLVTGARTAAGTYTASIYSFNATNYTLANATQSFTINKAPLTVTANDFNIIYGEDPAAATSKLGVTFNGFVNGENSSVLTGSATYSFNYKQFDDIGKYTVTPGGFGASNYAISYVPGSFGVSEKDVVVDIGNVVSANATDSLSYTIKSGTFFNGDEKYINLTKADGTKPGVYKVTGAFGNKNYKVTFTDGSYTILNLDIAADKALGITITSKDGEAPDLESKIVNVDIKEFEKSKKARFDFGEKVIGLYDISFEKNGTEVQPDGLMHLKFTVADEYIGKKLTVKHVSDDGKITTMYTVQNGNTLEVDANDFSIYAIVMYVDYTWLWIVIAVAGVLLLGGGGFCVYWFVIKKKKA